MSSLSPAPTNDSLIDDLRQSILVWRVDRAMPIIELVLWGSASIGALSTLLSFLTLPGLLFSVGWVGTVRIWYLRRFRGGRMEDGEVWRFTWAFFWPVVRLGLLMSAVVGPLVGVSVVLFHGHPQSIVLVTAPLSLLLDFALTFVTPALAFTTRRVRDALRIGLRMIRDEWPSSAAYVLVPPLAIVLVLHTLPFAAGGRAWSLSLGPLAALVSLAFRGAIAAFYLRRRAVGWYGSLEPPLPAPPRPDAPGY